MKKMKKFILLSVAMVGLLLTSCTVANDDTVANGDYVYCILDQSITKLSRSLAETPTEKAQIDKLIADYTAYMKVANINTSFKVFTAKSKAEADKLALDFMNSEVSRIDDAKVKSFFVKPNSFSVHLIYQLGFVGEETSPIPFGEKKEFGDLSLVKK